MPFGLSPRMRGNPLFGVLEPRDEGSIPAYAGEPCFWGGDMESIRVYPRVCGGTHRWKPPVKRKLGLSPRMRGNPEGRRVPLCWYGSIPAYAGEPPTAASHGSIPSVYPRVCGGTGACNAMREAKPGLSPRMRGNRDGGGDSVGWGGLSPRMRGNPNLIAKTAGRCRSIPAYAGEPASPF